MNQAIPESMLFYGEPLTGKTTQIGNIAYWIYKTTGKKTRLISCEGGGMNPLAHLIDLGIVDMLSVEGRPDLMPVLQDLSRGDWIINGKWVKATDKANDLSQIGLYVVEGLKFAAETFKTNMLGQGINFTDKDLTTDFQLKNLETGEVHKYGVPIQAHYGTSQAYLVQIISAFKTGVLKNLSPESKRIIFTTHTYEQELDPGKRGSKNRVGPATTGGALSKSLTALFSEVIHFTQERMRESIPSSEKGKPATVRNWTEYRAWFKDHKDKVIPDFWNASLRFSTPQIKYLKEVEDKLWEAGFMAVDEADDLGVVRLLEWKAGVKKAIVERIREELEKPKLG